MTEVEFDKDKYHLIEEMNRWLRENVGDGGWMPVLDAKWKIESAYGRHTYWFKDSKDAVLFALRWKSV